MLTNESYCKVQCCSIVFGDTGLIIKNIVLIFICLHPRCWELKSGLILLSL